MTDIQFGSTQAPRGHFILDAFNRNRQSIVSNCTSDSAENTRPSTSTFFSGRFWCAGGTSENLVGRVFFSQIIEEERNIGRCYNENDPTCEDFNDPLDTDGGVISIPEAGEIYIIQSLGRAVAIVASNGIWYVQGTSDTGFTPTSYLISQVYFHGTDSPQTITTANGMLYFWGYDGIYKLMFDEVNGMSVDNITQATIHELYMEIPKASKKNAKGIYDSRNKQVKWLYSSTPPTNDQEKYKYDSILVLDLQLNAFFRHRIQDHDTLEYPFIADIIENPFAPSLGREDEIVAGVDGQVTIGADNVVSTTFVETSKEIGVKFLTVVPDGVGGYGLTFSELRNNTNFLDWDSFYAGGIDSEAFALPSYETVGEPSREKRATYVTCHFNRTESGFDGNFIPRNPSSCLMQAQWDWADSASGNLYGTSQQVYRYNRIYTPSSQADTFDYGQSVLTTKTKIRGSGHVLTLKFSSEEGKDFQLLGWTTNVTIRA